MTEGRLWVRVSFSIEGIAPSFCARSFHRFVSQRAIKKMRKPNSLKLRTPNEGTQSNACRHGELNEHLGLSGMDGKFDRQMGGRHVSRGYDLSRRSNVAR